MNDKRRFGNIKILLLDVDGVLTTGDVIYTDSGEQVKHFNVKDGLGIRMLMKAGIQVGIITGRKAGALHHRCRNLGLTMVYDGVRDKVKVLETIVAETGIDAADIAYIGDDLPDLAIMRKVGTAIAVADAHDMIHDTAHIATRAKGGNGAVREICESILKSQNKWDQLVKTLFE